MKFWVLIFIAVSITGCQSSNRIDRYYDVELGSTKGEVLERIGSPRASTRAHGMDNWYYDLRPHSRSHRRVLIFDDGQLTYKGPIIPPPLTAGEEDSLKEKRVLVTPKKKYKRKHSDKQLRDIIKKEIQKQKPKKKPQKFEPI